MHLITAHNLAGKCGYLHKSTGWVLYVGLIVAQVRLRPDPKGSKA